MSRRIPLLLALCLAVPSAGDAAAPDGYVLEATVASVPATGGASFGSKFFFQSGDQVVYRIVPAGGTEGDPAAQWEYWSSATGAQAVLPASGYDSIDVRGMNAHGEVVGITSQVSPARNAALDWTLAAGPAAPAGFDAGFSALEAINIHGRAIGSNYSAAIFGPERVRWDSATPATPPAAIPLPAGYNYGEIHGISANGEVLLFVKDAADTMHAAVWDGATCVTVGPAPAAGETLYPSNLAINSAGDVAMLVFTAGGGYTLHFIPASDRTTWHSFTFPGPVTSVYNLQISGAGLASCDTGISGVNVVSIVSAAKTQQRTFPGYRSWLNASGEFVFGNAGKENYWDASAWTGAPVEVPLSVPTSSGGLDVVGFNDAGRLLVLNTVQATRSLSILAPAFAEPASVTLTPVRKTLRLAVGATIHRRLVKTRITGQSPDGTVRYVVRGRLPGGLRFRAGEALLAGRPARVQRVTLHVAATYAAAGVKKKSAYVAINVRVRAPASRPTR
ncbi:MAG: hypothetical protein PHC88_08080 [Terrimicrobiaceae bacterium]|nr:hypothetical protein [Terrimicrobiaceae bacterium]